MSWTGYSNQLQKLRGISALFSIMLDFVLNESKLGNTPTRSL